MMITNERQYRITRAQLERLRRTISEFDMREVLERTQSKVLAKAELAALKSEFENLSREVREYEALKSGTIGQLKANSVGDLPILLIKARIAKGLSQRELAQKLGLKEQQIQRYEAEKYASASLGRLSEVADALEINVREVADLGTMIMDRTAAPVRDIEWDMFPVEEMYLRNWFEGFSGSLAAAQANARVLLQDFVKNAIPSPTSALLRRRVRMGGTVNPYALLAWQCRVLTVAKKSTQRSGYDRRSMNEEWFRRLAQRSCLSNGPRHAKEYLEESGILLVIEPHLRHTHLDGAACLLPDGSPVVGLTLRYDRLDNFWFVLFHELAHVTKHIRKGKLEDIFDDLDAKPDEMEMEADELAASMLIPDDAWDVAIARYVRSGESVTDFADEIGISPAIVAGRIRAEADNYTILRDLVGQGEVRKHFPEVQFA